MALTADTIQDIARMIEKKVGMPYRDFEKLDFKEQQRLLKESGKKKEKPIQKEKETVILPQTKKENENIIYSEPGAYVKRIK